MKQKVSIKLLSVRGHQLMENRIQTNGNERAFEILHNLRRNSHIQMVGMIDEHGKKYIVGNYVPKEKLLALHKGPNLSSWDHLIVGTLKYKIEEDPTRYVAQVNAKDPIFVLMNKGDIVLDPLMNQIYPPVRPTTQKHERD